MTERQKKFADDYLITGIAYKSAINAGYSEKYAKTNSHKLLENTRIKAYIEEKLTKLESETVAEQKEVLEFLTETMRGEHQQEQVIMVPTGNGRGKLEKVKTEAQLKDRIKAAELLGKRYGIFTEKIESVNKNIEIVIGDWEDEEEEDEEGDG